MKTSFTRAGLIVLFLLVLLLGGCSRFGNKQFLFGAATPEAAAIQAVTGPSTPMPNFQVDQNSVTVLQKATFSEQATGRFMVMITFQGISTGNDAALGRQRCIFTYQVVRAQVGGWNTNGGGGGCMGVTAGPAEMGPMSINMGKNGGSGPGDPGYSEVDGQVFQNDIAAVQVTWSDNQVQKVPVISGSFLAARLGQMDMRKVQGLNEAGQEVYTNQPQNSPGKE